MWVRVSRVTGVVMTLAEVAAPAPSPQCRPHLLLASLPPLCPRLTNLARALSSGQTDRRSQTSHRPPVLLIVEMEWDVLTTQVIANKHTR